jgi:hypothetical protein
VEAGLEVDSAAEGLVVLAVGVRAEAGRVAVGSGAPGVPARPRLAWTGETPVTPPARE